MLSLMCFGFIFKDFYMFILASCLNVSIYYQLPLFFIIIN